MNIQPEEIRPDRWALTANLSEMREDATRGDDASSAIPTSRSNDFRWTGDNWSSGEEFKLFASQEVAVDYLRDNRATMESALHQNDVDAVEV